MYSDLAYYAFGAGTIPEKVGTYVREHGVRGLGAAVDAVTAAANIAAMQAWIDAHPLPQYVSQTDDFAQTRALVVAALAKARTALSNADAAAQAQAAADFTAAKVRYQTYAAAQNVAETPSALASWLSGLGLDVGSTVGKVAVIGALALGAYLVLPMVLRSGGGSRSW